MIAILKKELSTQFGSLSAMIIAILFLVIMGLFLWVYPDSSLLENGYASLQSFFDLAPWAFLFLIPAITMRLFSEEKKNGTLEIILTKPVRDWDLILGKFGSVKVILIFTLIPTLFYYLTLIRLGLPQGNIDHGAVWGSYLGLLMLGLSFASIGIFSSSLSSNPIIAFLLSGALSFFFYSGFESISKLPFLSFMDSTLIDFGIRSHYEGISRGVLDTRDLMYFLSLIGLFLYFTKLNLESRKW